LAVFDAYIRKMAEYVEDMRTDGRRIREFDRPGDPASLLDGLRIQVGPEAGQGVVLRGETFAEMGSPDAGSCAFPLWTASPDHVKDGRITLIGPDIPESRGSSLPFGQVLIVGGEQLGDKEHEVLDQNQYVADRIEGYMIKSTPGRMWCRISNDAAGKGLDFETLGRALMAIFKSEVPQVQAMEVVFVTSGKKDVERLGEIAEQVKKIGRDIVRETWLAKGYDILECTQSWDCGTCNDKSVCDEIREVVQITKKKSKKTAKPRKAAKP
jgi:CO dehydrogenase/acetyl-CoA synthase beta subunit